VDAAGFLKTGQDFFAMAEKVLDFRALLP